MDLKIFALFIAMGSLVGCGRSTPAQAPSTLNSDIPASLVATWSSFGGSQTLKLNQDGTYSARTGIDTGNAGTYSRSGSSLHFVGKGTINAIGTVDYTCTYQQPSNGSLLLGCSNGPMVTYTQATGGQAPPAALIGKWTGIGQTLTINSDGTYYTNTGTDTGIAGTITVTSGSIHFDGVGTIDSQGVFNYTCTYTLPTANHLSLVCPSYSMNYTK